jgi:predicted RNase H-like nuclease
VTAAKLPYKNLGGVVPCPGGWLVLPARLAGVTVNAEDPFVVGHLLDVLDWRPKFDAAAVWVPIGFFEEPNGPYRPCDLEARDMIGWPRNVAVTPVPSRRALHAATREEAQELEPWLTNADLRAFKRIRQAEQEFQPFHQRSFFAAHPDLSFTQLNSDLPLRTSPYTEEGMLERLELIRTKLPGVEEVLLRTPPKGAATIHVLRAGALLWTARRGAGRAVNRLPMDPNWDEAGMRMELVR